MAMQQKMDIQQWNNYKHGTPSQLVESVNEQNLEGWFIHTMTVAGNFIYIVYRKQV